MIDHAIFQVFYTFLGGLGIFFLGMKKFSHSLQNATSGIIQNIINSLTSNRFLAVMVGILITSIVQSSSATTVMVVSLVNAGLMQLQQALGVIFGANIGTTVTGWIISINVAQYGLLFVGLGSLANLIFQSDKLKNISSIILGIGFIFFGLKLMNDAVIPLRTNAKVLSIFSIYAPSSHLEFGPYILIGCLLTTLIQSSSAMLAITITMAQHGIITFPMAVALVLGENIGTTITALVASMGGNINAKRAARGHAIFNCIGAILVFSIFPYYIDFLLKVIPGNITEIDPVTGELANISYFIASAHSIFNILATLSFLPFIGQLSRFVTKITPDKKFKEPNQLVVLGSTEKLMPATSILQAQALLKKQRDIIERMFELTTSYILNEEGQAKILAKIKDYEIITDNMQKEITVFVCSLMQHKLTAQQSIQTQIIVRISDELESIADYLEKIAIYKTRFPSEVHLEGESMEMMLNYMERIFYFFLLTTKEVGTLRIKNFDKCKKQSNKLRLMANDIRDQHIRSVTAGIYRPLSSLTYSDIVVALRKIRSHSYNISQALFKMQNQNYNHFAKS